MHLEKRLKTCTESSGAKGKEKEQQKTVIFLNTRVALKTNFFFLLLGGWMS